MDENYTNAHRAFLQACARHSVLSTKLALVIFEAVQKNHGNAAIDDHALRTMVNEINTKFAECEIDQRLAFVNLEWDKPIGEFLVLCNTFASVGVSPVYNEAECIYMKNLMEKIITSDNHSISPMTAIHLCSASSQFSQSQSVSATKKVTKQRAEELMDEWIIAGYFVMFGDLITFGPKAIGEFRETFRTKFGDYIQNCHLCTELTLKPTFCPNTDCETALDKRCFKNYVLKKKKCPACKSDWDDMQQ